MGTSSASAAARMGSNRGSSRKRSSVVPLMSAPWKPSSRTARAISLAAASGSRMGRCAKPAKRSGWRAIASARASLVSRASATPSAPSTRSAPGPVVDSTCTVMPVSSIEAQPLLADLGRQLQRVNAAGQDAPGPEAAPGNGLAADVALHQRRDGEMLFERDDAHVQCLQAGSCELWHHMRAREQAVLLARRPDMALAPFIQARPIRFIGSAKCTSLRPMNQPLKLGIAGLGTVGTGLLQLLAEHGDRLARNVGRSIEVVGVSARSRSKKRARGARRHRVVRRPVRAGRRRLASTCSSS